MDDNKYNWQAALSRALHQAQLSNRRWYVRGWFSEQSNRWMYDAYSYPVLFAWKRRAGF